jgi:iron complex outermembrane receptor protein
LHPEPHSVSLLSQSVLGSAAIREDAMGSNNSSSGISLTAILFSSAAVTLFPAAAAAQTTSPPAATTTTSEQQSDSTTTATDTSADIVVTAQRREERLQDVPLSIVAVTGKELRDKDIRDITRLEQIVPGLRIGRSGDAARPAIRGVYTEAIQATSDPRIGFYIDEIYQSRLQQTTAAFVDLERVEVQKGPQGTLFGRNSLGGNIALTSARPKDRFDAGGAALYGSYNRTKLEGFINLPIATGIALRVAGALDRHDPIYKSRVRKAASIGDLNYQFLRGSLRIAPPSLDDRLEVIFRGSYYNRDDRGMGSFDAKNLGALVDPSLIRQPGQGVTFNGITYPLPFGYNGGNYATGQLVPFSPVFRDGIPDIGGADIGIPIGGKYEVLFDFTSPTNKVRAKNGSAIINFDVTDDIRFRSLTGYTDFEYQNRADGDGGPIPFREFYFITTAKTLTQEFQLQSANPASPLQYTVGAYYMDDKIGEGSGSVFSNSNYQTTTAAANGLPVLFASGAGCGYVFLPTNAPSSCNLNNTVTNDTATPVKARTKSYAGYAQASYTFADRLTLTAGARYTVDDKEYRQAAQPAGLTSSVNAYVAAQNAAAIAAGQPAPFTNPAGYRAVLPFSSDRADANFECGATTPGAFGVAGTNTVVGNVPNYFVTRCGKRKFKYWTYRLAADYKFSPDHMVYASFSTGVHSGGFGAAFTPTDIPQGTFVTFDAERAKAFELGTKNSFLDRRLQVNAAVFYNKYLDNQVQGTQFVSTGPNTGVNVGTIANVGDTKAPGAEINVVARPTNALTVRAALNYLRARNTVAPLGIFTSGLCTISTGSGPCVTNPIESRAGLGSGFFPNPFTNPELFVPLKDAAGNIVGYDTLFFGKKTRVQNTPDWSGSLGLSYEIPLAGGATITPQADLLYSGSYLLSASAPNFTQDAYAKIDARLTYRTADQQLSVQAFVQNLTNKATLGRITTGTLSAGGTYSEPRTYGVRLGYRF